MVNVLNVFSHSLYKLDKQLDSGKDKYKHDVYSIKQKSNNYDRQIRLRSPILVVGNKIFKEYLKLLNRLYDITWFGLVYA